MVTETPSALLERAAQLIEQRASEATPGPWRDLPMGSDGSVVLAGGNTISTARRPARCGEFGDATWIAMMSPVLAGPIAAMLRYEARTNGTAHRGELIRLARRILGDVSREEQQ